MLANGYVVSTLNAVTPSDSNPPELDYQELFYPTTGGYLYASLQATPTSVTPSDSTPPQLTQGNLYEPTANGYLYASSGLSKVKTGTFTIPSGTSNTVTVTCGFQPKYIAYYAGTSVMCIYNSDVSTTKWIRASSTGILSANVGAGYNMGLESVTSTGFTVKGHNSSMTAYYFAIG